MAKTGQAGSDVKTDGRGPGGRWLPGASPNPAGRPKASYLVAMHEISRLAGIEIVDVTPASTSN
ncbi:hypothetical protein WOC76_04065 [Methylocystis sp. IM3]|uniref:hypothetical protein n=1 Tax=unclassified Methylocystis TaxID=2625913 RepID=UPI0030FB7D70